MANVVEEIFHHHRRTVFTVYCPIGISANQDLRALDRVTFSQDTVRVTARVGHPLSALLCMSASTFPSWS